MVQNGRHDPSDLNHQLRHELTHKDEEMVYVRTLPDAQRGARSLDRLPGPIDLHINQGRPVTFSAASSRSARSDNLVALCAISPRPRATWTKSIRGWSRSIAT